MSRPGRLPQRERAPRDLRLLAGAVFLSALGDVVAFITLAVVVHDLTGSGLSVSALVATTLVPAVVLAPLAGLIADRVESVRVIVIVSIAQALIAAGLGFSEGLTAILVLSTLLAAGAAIGQPAEFALVPAVAREGRLTEANGLMESARYAGFAGGPLVAGVLLAAGGAQVALLVNAASFLAIAVAGAMMRARRPPEPAGPAAAPERARDGLAALLDDGQLRILVLASAAALLFISASLTVEVFFAKDVLGAGDAGYALLFGAWMVGMVAGATGLAARIPPRYVAAGALVALAVQGAGMGAQTIWLALAFALAANLVGGLGHGVKNTLLRTVIQQRVPSRLHGRAFAAYSALRNTAELAAVGAGGLLVSAVGAREALAIAGLGPVLAAIVGLALLHGRRRRRTRSSTMTAIIGRSSPFASTSGSGPRAS